MYEKGSRYKMIYIPRAFSAFFSRHELYAASATMSSLLKNTCHSIQDSLGSSRMSLSQDSQFASIKTYSQSPQRQF